MDEFEESSPAELPPKPSKTPSWIMLGFIAGALFVWALPRAREPAAPVPAAPVFPATAPAVATPLPRLTDVEAVFAEPEWSKYAVWSNDTTYICMWDAKTQTFRDCFEVVRRGDALFFRSITRPRNLRPLEGIPENSPLEFLNPVAEVRGIFGERIPQPPLEPPAGLPREK